MESYLDTLPETPPSTLPDTPPSLPPSSLSIFDHEFHELWFYFKLLKKIKENNKTLNNILFQGRVLGGVLGRVLGGVIERHSTQLVPFAQRISRGLGGVLPNVVRMPHTGGMITDYRHYDY